MTAADDVNLDDLKRRARRRLVGAIILALVVAVVVPMLLESDPKPLGEDVAVKIPPVDDGKFVNRLTDKSALARPDAAKAPVQKAEGKVEGKSEARPEARQEPPKAEPDAIARMAEQKSDALKLDAQKSDAQKSEAVKTDAVKADVPKDTPKAESPKADGAKAEAAKPDPLPAADAKAAPASPAKALPAQVANAAPNGDFAVQVFAFSDNYGANSLVGKLKRAGYPAYAEQVNTSKGTLWRVRIGPYASRETAGSARDKLKVEGYNGIVASK